MSKTKKITVESAGGERVFDATDFVLMPTGHLSIVHEEGVVKMDGTPQRSVAAVFAPGAWACVYVEENEEKSKVAM